VQYLGVLPGPQTQVAHRHRAPHRDGETNVTFGRRSDRSEMVALYKEKAQVCMIRVHTFGATGALQKATDLMVKLGEMLAADNLTVEGLYDQRDKMLNELGYLATRPGKSSKAKKGGKANVTAKAMKVARLRPAADDGGKKATPQKTKASATVAKAGAAKIGMTVKGMKANMVKQRNGMKVKGMKAKKGTEQMTGKRCEPPVNEDCNVRPFINLVCVFVRGQ
jgi:hypothetical protein